MLEKSLSATTDKGKIAERCKKWYNSNNKAGRRKTEKGKAYVYDEA